MLSFANLMVAGLQFLDPVLFGRVIDLLARAMDLPRDELWQRAATLLGFWGAVGAAGIGANIAVALQTERLAHRNRLQAMARYFEHVLSLPLSFHGDTHSGRLMKSMICRHRRAVRRLAVVLPRPSFDLHLGPSCCCR